MRTCACGCGTPLTNRRESTLYVNGRHRQRAYRNRVREDTTGFWEGLRSVGRPRPKTRDSTT